MSSLIDAMIGVGEPGVEGQVLGQSRDSLIGVYGVTAAPSAPIPDQSPTVLLPYTQIDPDHLVDGQVVGHTGPSLNDYEVDPSQRGGLPGFGAFNDQPWHSGPANFSPGVVPSQEVGTGKPPGWVAAHMPLAQGVNSTRSSYAYQGTFADGEAYPMISEPDRARAGVRAPAWMIAFEQPGQDPHTKIISQWPGSASIEQPQSMTLAEMLGRVTDAAPHLTAWGVQ